MNTNMSTFLCQRKKGGKKKVRVDVTAFIERRANTTALDNFSPFTDESRLITRTESEGSDRIRMFYTAARYHKSYSKSVSQRALGRFFIILELLAKRRPACADSEGESCEIVADKFVGFL